MTDNKRNNPTPGEWVATAAFFAAIALMLILNSCSPRLVENVRYQRDTTYIFNAQVDSVYRLDSVFVREKNDTVYQYVERIRYRYRFTHDTTYIHKVDTVYREKPVDAPVEKSLTWWQKLRINLGGFTLMAMAAALAILIVRILRKK